MQDRDDEYFMKLALHEAKKGMGKTSPNPCVGAIIVKNGEIIARGYHKKAGTPHAEVHALRAAGDQARGATMYVTLEPCNHTGKTPPCSHAVAAAGIGRVVVGMEDPNPLVDGTGITYLREQNIEVVSCILEKECREINRPFIKHISTGLPWIVMKAGLSLDGKLNYQRGKSGWITGHESGVEVHKLRNLCDAIMVGSTTVRIDNPSLTTRLPGEKGRDPIRIILDRELSLSEELKVFSQDSAAETWIFTSHHVKRVEIQRFTDLGARIFQVASCENRLELNEIFQVLGNNGVTSVLVEGGAALHGELLRQRLVDYAYLFIAPVFAGEKGISLVSGYTTESKARAVSLASVRYRQVGEDIMVEGELRYPSAAEQGDFENR